MSKYDLLGEYLKQSNMQIVKLSFNEIENILGFKLAKYLRTQTACWQGTAEGSPTHVAKRVWQEAGYIVDRIDLMDEYVIFKKI